MHWRGGDFLSGQPLSRYRGRSNLELHRMLANGSVMAAVAARAARAVGARHVLVLTNARLDRVAAFEAAMARLDGGGGERRRVFGHTVRTCSDAPAAAEKRACAQAAGLVLSSGSSFSVDILKLASPSTPHAFVGRCRTPRAWQQRYEGSLLQGAGIACA